ncbi:MAG: hypothetical protein E7583_08165 [Ruminococcaceae bacterium]|nr:hypothetical protein [Oscillospiraceae bacterium]
MAIASLVCGIVSVVFSTMLHWIVYGVSYNSVCVYLGLITGIAAIVLSILASRQNAMFAGGRPALGGQNTMILVGLILGIVGFLFGFIGLMTCEVCFCLCASPEEKFAREFYRYFG